MKTTKYILFYIIFFLLAKPVSAQKFRVSSTQIITIGSETTESQIAEIGYADVLAVFVEKGHLFLQGIEVEIKQKNINIEFPNSTIYAFYSDPNPVPDKNKKRYTATEILQDILPARQSVSFQIPVTEKHSIKQTVYSSLLNYVIKEDSPIMLRFIPVMKGLPPEVEKGKFTVKIKPVFIDKGGIKFAFEYPDEPKPISVRLNDSYITDFSSPVIVPSGTHQIEINSNHYKTEIRSYTVEKGKIQNLIISLKSLIPLLTIQAPENINIYLDGKELKNTQFPLKINQGNHIIKFKIGSYEIVRSLKAEEGKSYTVNLMMDVKIIEE